MLIKKPSDVQSSEITDRSVYLNRRLFMRGAILAGSAAATGLIYRKLNPSAPVVESRPKIELVTTPTDEAIRHAFRTNEPLTSLKDITNYNNFYEFSTVKEEVAVCIAEVLLLGPGRLTLGVWSTSQRRLTWTIC